MSKTIYIETNGNGLGVAGLCVLSVYVAVNVEVRRGFASVRTVTFAQLARVAQWPLASIPRVASRP